MSENEPTWWDQNISDHENYGNNINFAGKKFVVNLLSDNCQSILDVGCGNGLVYKALKESGRQIPVYKGVDLSTLMINACQKLYPERNWVVGDANKIGELDESYDDVLLFHIFESMDHYEDAIKGALKLAKNRVIIVFWQALTNREDDMVQPLPPNNFATLYSASKFFKFIKELGFTHTPWVELYVEDFRYNLFVVLDKEHNRVETAANL